MTEEFPADEQKMPKFGAPSFEKLGPAQTGVAFSHRMVMDHPLSRLNSSGFVCGGVCIGDFNGDGQADLFLANGPDQNVLFLQRDGFRFDNVTEQAGVGGGETWASGAAAVDFDADGKLDLYVCNYDAPKTSYSSTTALAPRSRTRRRHAAWPWSMPHSLRHSPTTTGTEISMCSC